MNSDLATPETLGPQIIGYLDWLIDQAKEAEGTGALGQIAEDLCIHFRALAICMLADDGNADDFFHWLLHSPLTRRHYLKSVHGRGLGEPRSGRASFVDPVLDAMAARQWKLAAEVTALTSADWLEGDEYEEDFCYGDFLRRALSGADVGDVLKRWEAATEGQPDRRLDVAEALTAKDSGEFEQALRSLLRANATKGREMTNPESPSIHASDYFFAPNQWISIEGLAWLALGERTGLSTDFEIVGCPALARASSYAPFRPRAYPNAGLD